MRQRRTLYNDKNVNLTERYNSYISKLVPKTHLTSESEWRDLGIQQSRGWGHYKVHYMVHEPEPHILLFRGHCPRSQRNESGEPFFSLKLYTAVLTC
uniref:Cyclin-dependent kinases regulatory subunit n=1 Tax=Sus scrofa TaxID=9823 RepID=A0A8D0RBW1_PIG